MIFNVHLSESELLHPKGLAVLSKAALWWQTCVFLNDLGWLTLGMAFFRKIQNQSPTPRPKYPWRQTATKELESIRRHGQGKPEWKQKNLVESYGRNLMPPKVKDDQHKTQAINLRT